MFGELKVISPRLTPRVRFALDQEGIGIQDSCICLAVSETTKEAFNELRRRLSKIMGRELKSITVYRYLLAFLNSSYAQDLLTTGRRPTPKGHYQIEDQFLEELSVPVCRTRRQLQNLLGAVEGCTIAPSDESTATAESHLNSLVLALYAED
jgi:CRISPR/Cas system-associated endoribonuclease Cas2